MLQRPQPSEYFEYYGRYIDLVPQGDILAILAQENQRTQELLAPVAPERADYRYEPGKWSVKQVIGHLIDAERLFAYRALHFARRDPAPLPSMEQDDWARFNNAAERTLDELIDEFSAVRRSHLALFRSFDAEMWTQRGTASGYEFSVRAFPWILGGHEIHHRWVLEERYLP